MVTRTFSGTRLNQLRLKRGATQEDFAHTLRGRGLKTSAKQIRRWEAGAHVPRATVIPILADALGVSMDELYADSDDDEESDAVADLVRSLRRLVREEVNAG